MATRFGRYTLLRKLATGGMAEVFLANVDGPMGFQKKCVVKRILPHFSDDPQFVQMFLGEARLAAELNHPNLVQIFDFGEVDGQYFIAMEYIEGPNLRVLNRELRMAHGPIPLPLAARIITLAAEGLQFAHDLKDEHGQIINLVHRDISPDNILVSRQGAVKVVDFGIAKAANQPHLTRSGMIKGKLAYMPPEQLAREPLDRRADLYALGVVLYELVCGEMPFDATSEVSIIQAIMGHEPLQRVRERRPDVPDALDGIIAKCLAKDPNERYPSCRELQQDLERFIQQSGTVIAVSDLAALVEQVFKSNFVPTTPNPMPDSASLDPTAQRPAVRPSAPTAQAEAQPRPSPPPPANPPPRRKAPSRGASVSKVKAPAPPPEPAPAAAPDEEFVVPRSNRTPLVIAGVVVALLAAGGVFYVFRPDPTVVSDATPLADAGARTVKPPPPLTDGEPDAHGEPVAVGTVAEPDSGSTPLAHATVDSGADVEPAVIATPKTGRLELRIRPYATVFIDGKEVGDTPLPPQQLTIGKHHVRLVNPSLGKDVALEVAVHPGDNVLKHNLKE